MRLPALATVSSPERSFIFQIINKAWFFCCRRLALGSACFLSFLLLLVRCALSRTLTIGFPQAWRSRSPQWWCCAIATIFTRQSLLVSFITNTKTRAFCLLSVGDFGACFFPFWCNMPLNAGRLMQVSCVRGGARELGLVGLCWFCHSSGCMPSSVSCIGVRFVCFDLVADHCHSVLGR